MAEYGFFVPAAGRSYIAGLMAGETLEISRIMVGSGKPATLEDMASLTDLVAPVAQGRAPSPCGRATPWKWWWSIGPT